MRTKLHASIFNTFLDISVARNTHFGVLGRVAQSPHHPYLRKSVLTV